LVPLLPNQTFQLCNEQEIELGNPSEPAQTPTEVGFLPQALAVARLEVNQQLL
jgi:hypothetical protein